jgi:hypothetical protein
MWSAENHGAMGSMNDNATPVKGGLSGQIASFLNAGGWHGDIL